MTQVAIAAIGAVALIIPALLAIPYGPRRRVALLHEKVRVLADLQGLDSAEAEELAARIRRSVGSDIVRMEVHEKYGTPISNVLPAMSGAVLLFIGVILLTTRGDTGEVVQEVARTGMLLMVVVGGLVVVVSLADQVVRFRKAFGEMKRLKSEREQREAEEDRRVAADSGRVALVEEAGVVRRQLQELRTELTLLEAHQEVGELQEKIRALREPTP